MLLGVLIIGVCVVGLPLTLSPEARQALIDWGLHWSQAITPSWMLVLEGYVWERWLSMIPTIAWGHSLYWVRSILALLWLIQAMLLWLGLLSPLLFLFPREIPHQVGLFRLLLVLMLGGLCLLSTFSWAGPLVPLEALLLLLWIRYRPRSM